jgi:prephenate dehydratase
VAFQGERGAYGDDAIQRRWRCAAAVPSWTFEDVVRAVLRGTVDYGVLPVENTVVGAVLAAQAAMAAAPDLQVMDDILVPVRHALLAPPSATLDRLTMVASHPVALAQCGRFLERHGHLHPREAYDTAGAARDVAARNDPTESAIASVTAAARYKLQVMAEDIQDVPNNVTRFVVIAAKRRVTSSVLASTAAVWTPTES